jgi:tRNA pseudouridine32 synthase / 23S rRNA pseudouridine746 synthase
MTPLDIKDYILYEDDDVIAINKPAGLRTIADGYDRSLPHLAGLLQVVFGQIWIVHRLDKDTSGVVLFAHNAEAHRHLNKQFQSRETSKEYRALVLGHPDWARKTIHLPLKVDGDRSHRTIVDEKSGKPAETELEVLRTFASLSLIAAHPRTGYTHQIRTHLAAVGLPILHDPLYKSRMAETQLQKDALVLIPTLPIQRIALHAYQLSFQHPATGQNTTIIAPEPTDFAATVQMLG